MLYYKVAIHYEQQYDKMGTPSIVAAIELFKIFVKSVVQLVYHVHHFGPSGLSFWEMLRLYSHRQQRTVYDQTPQLYLIIFIRLVTTKSS